MGKKSLAEIAMSYGYVYVGQIALGANPAQALKVIQEAEAYNGKSTESVLSQRNTDTLAA